ncbi:MAG: TauD/TfdA family dioxygenase [Nisaea sp.]|nr:TauD/TfdA family dioxygenase [Nisaea sp.]
MSLLNSIKVSKRHPFIGAEVTGVDLRTPLDEDAFDKIHSLWMENLVLIFPNQLVSDEQHIKFANQFGNLEVHPSLAHRSTRNKEIYRVSNVDESGNIIRAHDTAWQYINLSWLWHTDSSFRSVPSKGSILHGIETTREGGNTLFANMYQAYSDLDADTKRRVDGLYVVHDHDFIIKQSRELSKKSDKGSYDKLPPVRHPLVQIHPVTGRRSLFLSPHTMDYIEGMERVESRKLLDELIHHAIAEKFVYRHNWTNHDIVMWDNRCTMHAVEPFDNTSVRRIMHRVTLVGDSPPMSA